MENTQNKRGDILVFFLLFVVVVTAEGLHDFLASDSVIWGLIKSSISLAAKSPEEYSDYLSFAEESWGTVGTHCQTSALVIGIASFLIGIIVMHWINRMGLKDGIKHFLTFAVFLAVIILIVKLIAYFLF